MKIGVKTVGPSQLGECPAAVTIGSDGSTLFLLNTPVLSRFPVAQQRFILAHELGHRLLPTPDEQLADAFALGLTAGRQPQSLKNAFRSIASFRDVPLPRLQALYQLCLRADKNK